MRRAAVLFLVALLPTVARAQDAATRARALCAELGDPARAESAFSALLELGPAAAQAALDGFGDADLAQRRARSLVVRETGRGDEVPGAIALLGDPDPQVRDHLISFLARPELRVLATQARAEALEREARDDPEERLRGDALDALGRIDDPVAVAALERVMDSGSPRYRVQAARALANLPSARERVVERVQQAFAGGAGAAGLEDDALAVLFGGAYGQRLAEVPAGGSRPRDLVPFVLGARHPALDVRRGAAFALDRFVARARFLGEVARADRLLASLEGRGLDDGDLLSRRARLALGSGDDAEVALDAARRLAALSGAGDDAEDLRRRGTAGLLEAAALLALDRPDEAGPALDAADRATRAIVARRLDRLALSRASVQVEMLERLALVEVYRALAILWENPDPSQPAVLEHMREAHIDSLRAQLALTSEWSRLSQDGSRPPQWSLDTVIGDDLSPWLLVFANPKLQHVPAKRATELQRVVLVALASVAPLELPGFQPVESVDATVGDPRKDPERCRLLSEIMAAYLQGLEDAVLPKMSAEDEPDPGALRERYELRMREIAFVKQKIKEDEGTTWRIHLSQRVPSDAALTLAETMREEGRTAASRALAERMLKDLEAAGEYLSGSWGAELTARAEVAVGASWMDEDQPDKAEALYLSALQRLENLEKELTEQGVSEAGLSTVRLRRADVLVSLAVNANVKRRAPKVAVDYFERAYALREDDFMRVMLACYRARAGRDAEARAVLRDLPVSPPNYYNLACTYALLGERDLALDFLRRDFAEMRNTPGQLERQKTWARGDPDLEALRGDPAFEALVAATPGAEEER